MEEGEDKGKGFKVQDRRRFSAEGEPRSEAEEESSSQPAPAQAAAAAAQAPSGTDRVAAASAEAQYAGAQNAAEAVEISFANFVVGLSMEALAALGEIPDPATGKRSADLRAAQQFIDIIGMLGEKTRGNLDRDEEKLIETILFDLRMKYVEIARPSGR
jgi:Domain of unknown function (DUF1844)